MQTREVPGIRLVTQCSNVPTVPRDYNGFGLRAKQSSAWRRAMILNRLEFMLMNNPLRAALQRHVEARRFLEMGGPLRGQGARALEIGCGRGIGVELILDLFGATSVDAFDLDPRMVALAQRRLNKRGAGVRLWVGDATSIAAPDATYDAVFDFGIIHHVPRWRDALAQIHRVLRPGGLLYAEEPLGAILSNPSVNRLFVHPVDARFDAADFCSSLRGVGLRPRQQKRLWHTMLWVLAQKG